MAVISKDKINTKYRELFTVKLQHAGFGAAHNNNISEAIRIEPDELTGRLFGNYNMGYRFINDTLMCFIRTGMFAPPAPLPVTAFVKFGPVVLFRFFVFAGADFLAKTNVAAAGAGTVYQFTNQVNAGSGGFITMHTNGVNDDDLKPVAVVMPAKNCFAVIDIFTAGASGSSYEVFDTAANQQLKSPAYAILFKSKI